MRPTDLQQELQDIQKRMIKVAAIDAPAAILLGIGLFAKFGENPQSLHPLLGNSGFTTGILIISGIVVACCAKQMVSLAIRRSEVRHALNT